MKSLNLHIHRVAHALEYFAGRTARVLRLRKTPGKEVQKERPIPEPIKVKKKVFDPRVLASRLEPHIEEADRILASLEGEITKELSKTEALIRDCNEAEELKKASESELLTSIQTLEDELLRQNALISNYDAEKDLVAKQAGIVIESNSGLLGVPTVKPSLPIRAEIPEITDFLAKGKSLASGNRQAPNASNLSEKISLLGDKSAQLQEAQFNNEGLRVQRVAYDDLFNLMTDAKEKVDIEILRIQGNVGVLENNDFSSALASLTKSFSESDEYPNISQLEQWARETLKERVLIASANVRDCIRAVQSGQVEAKAVFDALKILANEGYDYYAAPTKTQAARHAFYHAAQAARMLVSPIPSRYTGSSTLLLKRGNNVRYAVWFSWDQDTKIFNVSELPTNARG